MPGESRCFKCGSVLSGQGVAVDVHPPRMDRWKGPFRAVPRWIRLRTRFGERLRVPAFLRIMSGNAALGLVLSLIPGLAQAVSGRFREVRWFVFGWLLLLPAGIFFYGSGTGYLLLGIAVGLHGWIAFRHSLMKEHAEIGQRIFDFSMLLVVFGLLYFGVRSTLLGDFMFGYTNLTIPYQNIESGDMLLARRSLSGAEDLKRGGLVQSTLRMVGRGRRVFSGGARTIVQIVGLGGEKIEITDGAYVVDGRMLDGEQYPVPEWLKGRKIGPIVVDVNSYFVNAVYNVEGRGMQLTAEMVGQACIVKSSEIESKVIMRWFPLKRRGFLKENE